MINLPTLRNCKSEMCDGDILIVVGEVFDRGYASGFVDEAKRRGVKVIYTTTGRRDQNYQLRPLNEGELNSKGQSPIVNVPIEAGFEFEQVEGKSLAQLISKSDSLVDLKVDFSWLERAVVEGRARFFKALQLVFNQISEQDTNSANVFFLHTMAGGIPRGEAMLGLLSKLFRPNIDNFISSDQFFSFDIGKVCEKSFQEVSAESFRILIEASEELRNRVEAKGGRVKYIAYGYHGSEVNIGDRYQWQALGFYLQASAKDKLELYAKRARANGVNATVYNVPECVTNSGKIFPGIELPIYFLVNSIFSEASTSDEKHFKSIENFLASRLSDEANLSSFRSKVYEWGDWLSKSIFTRFELWPFPSSLEAILKRGEWSREFKKLHKNPNQLLALDFSETIVKSTGIAMCSSALALDRPVVWIGHDLISKIFWREKMYEKI